MATLKQVGDQIRTRLKTAQARGSLPGQEPGGGYGSVRYDVRVSNGRKSGPAVSVTINDYGWLILAYARRQGGQGAKSPDSLDGVFRGLFGQWRDTEGKELMGQVDEIVSRDGWGATLGGETKFGPLLISATATRVTTICSRHGEYDSAGHDCCPVCAAELQSA